MARFTAFIVCRQNRHNSFAAFGCTLGDLSAIIEAHNSENVTAELPLLKPVHGVTASFRDVMRIGFEVTWSESSQRDFKCLWVKVNSLQWSDDKNSE